MGDIYKRKLQTHSFFVGLAIAVGMNIDTILVTHQLYHSEPLRSFLASIGEDYSRNETTRICSDRR